MSHRISVKMTTSCGNTWISGFNATYEEAVAYFMGMRCERLVADKKSWAGVREVLEGPVIKVELVA